MKFKAKLDQPRTFLGVLQIFRSVQSECIVRLQEPQTRFFTSVSTLDGVQVWMGCRTDYLFSGFTCDSHYQGKSITCEILSLQQLMHALRQAGTRQSSSQAVQAMIRLARNGATPLLKLTLPGASQNLPDLSYDVPVRILSDREVEEMHAPPLEDDRVQVVVPNLPELTTFVDKISSTMCDSITFTAQSYSAVLSGRISHKRGRSAEASRPHLATFQVEAENPLAEFSLKYDAVKMIPKQCDTDEDEDDVRAGDQDDEERNSGTSRHRDVDSEDDEEENQAARVSVDVKKFARFLSTVKEIDPTQLGLYLVDQRALVLSAQASGNTTMIAYIPARRE